MGVAASGGRQIEIIIDYGLTDIVARGFDAVVRSGEQSARDMIAVRLAPDMRMAVVGAPSSRRPPKRPQDLIGHNRITLRLPTHGGLYASEFEKGWSRTESARRRPPYVQHDGEMLNAAVAGMGLAYVPGGWAKLYLAKGRLKRVLEDWCLPYSGYHLYYPSRRQHSAACALGGCATVPRLTAVPLIPFTKRVHNSMLGPPTSRREVKPSINSPPACTVERICR